MVATLAQAVNKYALAVGSRGETTCHCNKVGDSLARFGLVTHWATNIAVNLNAAFQRLNANHIAIAQRDIHCRVATKQEVIDVALYNYLARTQHLNVAKATNLTHATSCIERVEERCERREGIGAGISNLTYNIHLNTADIAKSELNGGRAAVNTGIDACQRTLDACVCFLHGVTREGDRAYSGDVDSALGGDCAGVVHLSIAPNINQHLIARAEHIVVGSGNVEVGLKTKTATENVTAVDVGTVRCCGKRCRLSNLSDDRLSLACALQISGSRCYLSGAECCLCCSNITATLLVSLQCLLVIYLCGCTDGNSQKGDNQQNSFFHNRLLLLFILSLIQ